jgi:hypothetical protein
LLEIFDFYRNDHYNDCPVWEWHVLVHVCQRWRQIVFASPHRLNLQILCTHGTPFRKNIGIWPTFPIVLNFYCTRLLTPNDEDNAITALKHPDRVSFVNLRVTSSQLGKVARVMQKPFPVLKRLYIDLYGEDAPVLPGGFLGQSAPCLQEIALAGIAFPALPALLLSASHLVSLELHSVPPTGYISPEAMVACLAALPRLDSFTLEFMSPTPRPDQIRPPPGARTVLPALTFFHFHGATEYLEDLVAKTDSPRLDRIIIVFLDDPDFRDLDDFQAAQLSKFIDRSVGPELTPSRRAHVSFDNDHFAFTLYRHANGPGWDRRSVETTIACEWIDWPGHVPYMAEVLSHFSATLSTVIHLELIVEFKEDCQLEGTESVKWLLLFRQFPAVQILFVSWALAEGVALALEDITGEMVAKVLPSLDLICLRGQTASSIKKFVAARRLSDRPVTVVDTRKEFDDRLESYVSK